VQVHANAKLVPSSRLLLVRRVLEESWKVRDVAVSLGISERTAYRWLARWRAGDHRLLDRSLAPKRIPRRTPRRVERVIEQLRRLRLTSTRIAAQLDMAVSTVGAVLSRLGLNRLSRLEPPEPPNRYQRRRPGELVHLDIKQLGRFERPGHRVTGRKAPLRRTHRAGWEYVHVAVDDHSRLAYVEVLPDQRSQSAIEFLERMLSWFRTRGRRVREVMTDNGSCYIAHNLHRGVPHPRAAPHQNPTASAPHQRQSGTIHPDPAPRMGLGSRLSHQPSPRPGTDTLARRPHSALGHRTPASRLTTASPTCLGSTPTRHQPHHLGSQNLATLAGGTEPGRLDDGIPEVTVVDIAGSDAALAKSEPKAIFAVAHTMLGIV
jgi:transposase